MEVHHLREVFTCRVVNQRGSFFYWTVNIRFDLIRHDVIWSAGSSLRLGKLKYGASSRGSSFRSLRNNSTDNGYH